MLLLGQHWLELLAETKLYSGRDEKQSDQKGGEATGTKDETKKLLWCRSEEVQQDSLIRRSFLVKSLQSPTAEEDKKTSSRRVIEASLPPLKANYQEQLMEKKDLQ